MTLTLGTDVLTWMRAAFPDWQGQINSLLRFFHDISVNREASFDPDAFEPGEIVTDVPIADDLEGIHERNDPIEGDA